jgi:phosphoribosylformylglycinamidine synthase
MSGSFGDLDVPPTLISFAVGVRRAEGLLSPEFKGAGHPVYLLPLPADGDGLPRYDALLDVWKEYGLLCDSGKVLSAWVCDGGGVCGGLMKMAFGNMLGFSGTARVVAPFASLVFEAAEEIDGYKLLGYTQDKPVLDLDGESVPLEGLREAWERPLESVFPVKARKGCEPSPLITDLRRSEPRGALSVNFINTRPKAVIPVFPGTNCEYDTQAALERAGGDCEMVLVRNLTPQMLEESVTQLEKAIRTAQMLIFPGGFSGGDEPDGSGKFILSLFRNPRLVLATHELLERGDGLILGICNGFQALVKLGLLPFGRIAPATPDSPTLTFNDIGRHRSLYVKTRVSSVRTPWLSECAAGEEYMQPISHGEGRFVADAQTLEELRENGQIVFQYADFNPNGSVWNIEGICSPDGRVLGKMAHTERYNEYTAVNVPGNKFIPLFEGGVKCFR